MTEPCPHHDVMVEQVSKLCNKVDEFIDTSHKNEVRVAAQIATLQSEQNNQSKRQDSMTWTLRACGLCLLSIAGKVVYDIIKGV